MRIRTQSKVTCQIPKKKMHVAAGAKGGKMRACKLQEVLDLLPIG